MKKFSFITLLIVAMLAVAGCGNSNNNATNNNANNNQDSNEAEGNSNADQSEVNAGTLKLGETGLVKDEIGEYEITPQSVEIFDEYDILGIRLMLENKEGNKVDEKTYFEYDFVESITEPIEPGETYEGQLFFDPTESIEYTLHFGSSATDIEDAKWFFTEDEAK